jgi:hypothetical protein
MFMLVSQMMCTQYMCSLLRIDRWPIDEESQPIAGRREKPRAALREGAALRGPALPNAPEPLEVSACGHRHQHEADPQAPPRFSRSVSARRYR